MSEPSHQQHKRSEATSYLRRVAAASMAGTVVEWYEFFLYGTAARLARAHHRRPLTRQLQVRGPHRLVPGGKRGGERYRRPGCPRDQGCRPGRHRPHRRRGCEHTAGSHAPGGPKTSELVDGTV